MNCHDFENLLLEADADARRARHSGGPRAGAGSNPRAGGIADNLELLGHTLTCADCREKLEDIQLLSDALSVWKAAPPRIDVTDAVLSAWKSSQRPVVTPIRLPDLSVRPAGSSLKGARNSLLSMFGGLALLFLLAFRWDAPVAAPRPPAPIVSVPAAEPPVDALVRTAGHAWLALATRAGSDVRDAAQLVLPQTLQTPGDPTAADFLGGVEQSLQPWQDRLGHLGQWLDRGG